MSAGKGSNIKDNFRIKLHKKSEKSEKEAKLFYILNQFIRETKKQYIGYTQFREISDAINAKKIIKKTVREANKLSNIRPSELYDEMIDRSLRRYRKKMRKIVQAKNQQSKQAQYTYRNNFFVVSLIQLENNLHSILLHHAMTSDSAANSIHLNPQEKNDTIAKIKEFKTALSTLAVFTNNIAAMEFANSCGRHLEFIANHGTDAALIEALAFTDL